LILWDLESGEIIHRFPAPLAESESVVFHPDGRTAFAVAFNKIYQWDLETGDQIRFFEGHNDSVRMIDISHDGHHMISSDYSGGIILWDLVFGEPLVRFAQAALRSYVAFHPDGRTALSASRDGTVVLWDLFNANEIRRFEGHEGGVFDVEFTPDGRYILSSGGSHLGLDVPGVDNTIRIWDMETGEQVQILEGHEAVVPLVEVSPDGRKALTLSQDGAVRYWDLESGAELRRFDHPGTPFTIALHPDGKRALIGTGEPSLLVWDLESGEVTDYLIGHEGWLLGLDVSPDGKTALSGDHYGSLILWDLESGRQLRRLHYDWPPS
jgi:WD40 repeat protein